MTLIQDNPQQEPLFTLAPPPPAPKPERSTVTNWKWLPAAALALAAALTGCGTASSPAAQAASPSVSCGLTSCSSGHVGQPCSAAGYPGIIKQAGRNQLACDPKPANAPATAESAPRPSRGWPCLS
jgi:hypothetical protein